jgi:drug/metabolite transporter (DMT)-like permease
MYDLKEQKTFSTTDFYLLLSVIIWGSDYLFAKIALREISPTNFAAMRTLISAVVMIPVFMKLEKSWSVSAQHFLWLIGLAFLGTFMNRILGSVGLSLTTASNSALLMATSPVFVLIASAIFFSKDVTSRVVLAILVSFVGVYLVIRNDWIGWTMGSETFRGDLIILASAASWAMFTFLTKPLLKVHSSLKVTSYVMFFGTILFSPIFATKMSGRCDIEIEEISEFRTLPPSTRKVYEAIGYMVINMDYLTIDVMEKGKEEKLNIGQWRKKWVRR